MTSDLQQHTRSTLAEERRLSRERLIEHFSFEPEPFDFDLVDLSGQAEHDVLADALPVGTLIKEVAIELEEEFSLIQFLTRYIVGPAEPCKPA